jgi:UDP-N-acetyl-D-galactosamine dehydrogenase
MGFYIAKQTIKKLNRAGKNILKSKVLVMGATFKEDVTDIRNSRVADLINELKSYEVDLDVVDPFANSDELMHEYGFELLDARHASRVTDKYDAVIVAVAHKPYLDLDEAYFKSILNKDGILVDVKGIYRKKIKELDYWSL